MIAKSIFYELISSHYITLVLIAVFAIKLSAQKVKADEQLRYFWMTTICCFILVLQDAAESVAAMDPSLRFLRIFLSIVGYVLRPVAVIGLLLVVCPPERRTWKTWIPAIVNLAVFLTAFFSPIAFSFDQDYAFVRGPLGYCVFVVAFLYMFQLLYVTWRRFYDRNHAERWILIVCAASCIVASIIDAIYGGCHLNEAMMTSSVFFYLFLRSHDNRLDPLTALGNRFAFYEDIQHQQKSITAVASLDMNGLKHINDTQGHAEGDRALAQIGRCLGRLNRRDTSAYRIGGDEFVILFLRQDCEAVESTLDRAKAEVAGAGLSVSAGYSMRSSGESVESALQRSDQIMYNDKAEYYRQSGIDRRRR